MGTYANIHGHKAISGHTGVYMIIGHMGAYMVIGAYI